MKNFIILESTKTDKPNLDRLKNMFIPYFYEYDIPINSYEGGIPGFIDRHIDKNIIFGVFKTNLPYTHFHIIAYDLDAKLDYYYTTNRFYVRVDKGDWFSMSANNNETKRTGRTWQLSGSGNNYPPLLIDNSLSNQVDGFTVNPNDTPVKKIINDVDNIYKEGV